MSRTTGPGVNRSLTVYTTVRMNSRFWAGGDWESVTEEDDGALTVKLCAGAQFTAARGTWTSFEVGVYNT
jgi:hypothetical protein